MAAVSAGDAPKSSSIDIASIAICTFAWGTTWFAITKQLGVVDPEISVVYRFALSAVLLFVCAALMREKIWLNRRQHLAAFGCGFCTFTINYPLVYVAEESVSSAVVAVLFASMAFSNLIVFRLLFGQRAPLQAWGAAALGIGGVVLLSWGEIFGAPMGARMIAGIGLTLLSVVFASLGNAAAHKGDQAGTPVASATAWAMAYGAASLALFSTLTGHVWRFEATPAYVLSLLYLAVLGSVIAFLLYFALARRRGYATASYISAMAPLLAMLVSSVLEHKRWGAPAFGGVALVLVGQVLLLRLKRAD